MFDKRIAKKYAVLWAKRLSTQEEQDPLCAGAAVGGSVLPPDVVRVPFKPQGALLAPWSVQAEATERGAMKTRVSSISLSRRWHDPMGGRARVLLFAVLLSFVGSIALLSSPCGLGSPPLSLAGEGAAPRPETEAATSTVTVTILHITDFHGALLSEDVDRATGKPIGGAAIIAALVEAERQETSGEVILLGSGDMMQGSAISNLSEGEAVVQFMNTLGFDGCAIGNHEFDWGIEVLKDRIANATFPFLCANVFTGKGTRRPGWAVPFTVLQRGTLKVGIIGVITTDTPFVSNPKNLKGLRFDKPEPIVNKIAQRLRREGVQLVVVLAHIGGQQQSDGAIEGPIANFASRLKGVDVVLGGHSHTVVTGQVGSIPVIISGSDGRRMGMVELEVDLSSGRSSLVGQGVKPTFSEGIQPDKAVASVVESFQKKLSGELDRVIAVASEKIARSRRESPLGNLISDIMREAVDAAIAFQNSGGIRADLEEGPVTARQIYRMLPFENTIVTMYLTGEQVKQVLEEGTTERGVVQVSGIRYSYRAQDPPGQRIKGVTLEDGTPLSPRKHYLVATNDFMASGGDRFKVFGQGKRIRNTQILLRDAVISWMEVLREAGGQLTAPELGRAEPLR